MNEPMGRLQKIITTSIWAITVLMMVFIVTVGVRLQRSFRNSANASLNAQSVTGPNAIVQADPAMAISQAAQVPILFEAPSFQLVDQQGKPFDNARLKGKPWLCQFMFTSCTSICPMMLSKMARLQQSVDPAVQLISFSVDPDNDRPTVLAAKAKSLDADPTRWHFLTNPDGVKDGIDMVQRGMFQPKPGPAEPMTMHSDKFFLVDGDGHVRGIYSSADENQMIQLHHETQLLAAAGK